MTHRVKASMEDPSLPHDRAVTQPTSAATSESLLVGTQISRGQRPLRTSAHSLEWARDGDRLLLASGGRGDGNHSGLALWRLDTDTDTLVLLDSPPFMGTRDSVVALAWVRDGKRLLLAASGTSGGGDGDGRAELGVWKLEDGSETLVPLSLSRSVLRPHPASHSLAWVRDGSRSLLAAGRSDGSVALWELVAGADSLRPFLTPPQQSARERVTAVAWARDSNGLLLAVGQAHGSVGVWLVRPGSDAVSRLDSRARVFNSAVRSLAWVRDGDRLILAAGGGGRPRDSDQGLLSLWEFGFEGRGLTAIGSLLPGFGSPVRSLRWLRYRGALLLASGGGDGGESMGLWRLGAGEHTLVRLDPSSLVRRGRARSLAWVRDRERLLLATAGQGQSLRLWQIEEHATVPVPAYRSDTVGDHDDLAREDEARALAELITARSVQPPLAVGLFGDWGEGKSHFLRLLQCQVDQTAQPHNSLAHHAVRQVRFNAWHYAETSLWAGLVAELFTQLASSAEADSPAQAQRSLSRLTAELVAGRQLPQRLAALRSRSEQLHKALEEHNPWDFLTPEQQDQVAALVGKDVLPAALYRQAVSSTTGLRQYLATAASVVREIGTWKTVGYLLLFLLALSLILFAPHLWRVTAALPGLGWAIGFGSTFQRKRKVWGSRLEKFQEQLRGMADGEQQRLRTAAEVTDREIEVLQTEMQNLTAAGQLAGMVGDRAVSTDYRSRLGVMTQIREDFQRMARLLAQEASTPRPDLTLPDTAEAAARADGAGGSPDVAGDELPRIDRIVVYIDDLDRCPPARVVEMLEAVHLLLAVELFVVVVAIDPRWLLKAVTAHYRDVLDAPASTSEPVQDGDGESWQSGPSQYLEKIFQVVLALPPLDTGGYQRMLHSLIGTRVHAEGAAVAPPGAAGGAAAGQTATGADLSAGSISTTTEALDVGSEDEDLYGPRVATIRRIERSDPLTLEPDELAFLDCLGPPLLVRTPRDVKRLANSYGLLTALRRGHRVADLTPHRTVGDPSAEYRPHRAGMLLLAALVAYPALGPALCRHLHRQAIDFPDGTWSEFLDSLQPQWLGREGGWHNDPVGQLTSPAADQWHDLHRALSHATREAADRRLHLPDTLAPWLQWVVPVARLSFRSGRIAQTLRDAC